MKSEWPCLDLSQKSLSIIKKLSNEYNLDILRQVQLTPVLITGALSIFEVSKHFPSL